MFWGGYSNPNPIPLMNVIICPQSYGDSQFWIFFVFPGGGSVNF